jgi:hypothetical protein
MGLLLLAFIGAGGLKAGSVAASAGASKVVIGLAFCVGLLGLLSSFREIVKELPIFRRERSTGLSTSAYLASKLLVFGPFVVVQGVVITALIVARQQGPHVSNVIQPPLLELMVDMALTGVAAMVTGLVISAAVATQDKAVPVVVLVVLLQLVATGALFPIKGGAAVVTSVVSVRWGFAAAASSVDVPTLMHGQCVEDKPGHAFCDPSWRHTARAWGGNLAGLAVIIVVGTLAAAFFLRRRDPTRGRRRRVRA